ncbi:MAG TPA: acyl-CoA dehydrogenase family protein [Aromatoleum sp.]|uniref:acyl-CoA dehydrogenase family protein n=1 Tax=Aromatoleum sp. TaxID=2307007 RepID=UPI002B49CF1E|nr:acyl-CoA dehydrogenase family protein [Aromatoleum sp.]HJV27677.1 acyl-CoA dehydrogenase family protein [Aromatoleum sp.]
MENGVLLSDEQLVLQETAASFLAEFGNARKPPSEDGELWRRLCELGWPAVQVPEEFDGLGLGAVELALLMEEMGRRLLRSPFLASVVLAQTALLHAADASARARLLPGLATGERRATLILAPGMVWAPAELPIRVRRDGAGWMLDGSALQVLDGDSADLAFVAARFDDGSAGLFEVGADAVGLERVPLSVWDETRPQSAWHFRGVRLEASGRIDTPQLLDPGLARTVAVGALHLAAEQVGGAAQCLDLSVAYTKERLQFGRPIASFQAVKHRCAEMMVKLETARSAVRGIAARVDRLDDGALQRDCAVARVLATDAYRFCAQEAVQLHGGVGFTWEYDPQLHFKRAQWGSGWFGGASAWREQVAASLLDAA